MSFSLVFTLAIFAMSIWLEPIESPDGTDGAPTMLGMALP